MAKTHIGFQEGLKLAGNDTEVVPVDVKEYRDAELERCYKSIDYFAERYFTIINKEGKRVPIKLYKKQSELLHKFQDFNNVCVLSPRQVGKSTSYSIFFVHKIIFEENFSILIAANKSKSAKGVLKNIKDAYEQIPNWMKPGIVEWNKQSIIFDNGVRIDADATSDSTGRSGTNNIICLDEFAFVRPSVQEEFWNSVIPTISSKGSNAKVFVISTANGVGNKYHQLWMEATTNPKTEWCAHRIDWWDVPGRDEVWHKREIARLGSEEAFNQEYGCSFLDSTGNKLVPNAKVVEFKEKYESLKIEAIDIPVNIKSDNCKWTYKQYEAPKPNRTYIGSADSAEGTGEDSSVFYIFDITEGTKIKMVASFASNKILPSDFAYVIHHISEQYFKPKLMIESNSIGVAVIDALTRTVFNDTNVIRYNRKNNEPGIFSHVQTKSKACLHAQSIIQNRRYDITIADKKLIEELPFFEKKTTSQHIVYKASKDKHDDRVLAFIWALYGLSEDILTKNFEVEFIKDDDTGVKLPIFIANIDEDLNEKKIKNTELSKDDKLRIAMKWYELGDDARASFILQTMFDEEDEEHGTIWNNNPYQLDPSLFSKGFFGDRYSDTYREDFSFNNDGDPIMVF